MAGTIYYLDTNVFIECAKKHYAFDFAPGFWKALEQHAQTNTIFTIDRIIDEIKKGHDELTDWVPKHFGKTKIKSDSNDIIQSFGEMMAWVESQAQFFPAAKAEFAAVADGWLIASAKVNNAVVVSHEGFSPDIKRKVPIPNVCRAFDIKCIDVIGLIRELKISLN